MSTPYANSQLKKKNRGDYVDQTQYAQIIGSLLHLMNFLRSEIAYVIGRLSKYTYSSDEDYGIEYSRFPVVLEGYSDVNWIFNLDETKSTSSYVLTLGGGAIA